jgi:DNA primase
VVEEIKRRVTLRDTFDALGVKVKGRVACCPLHQDKTPSLSFKDSGLWYCFVCGVGGDIFELVMKVENLTFKESLSWFNEKFNLGLTNKRYKPDPMVEALRESYENLKRDFLSELNELQIQHRVLMWVPTDLWDWRDYCYAEQAHEAMDLIEEKLRALENARYSVRG